MGKATFTPSLDEYRFYDDGSLTGATALGSQSTSYDYTVTTNHLLHLRFQLQENAGANGANGDDWTLQRRVNGGSWADVPLSAGSGIHVEISNTPANGASVTTSRLTGGTGTFLSGEYRDTPTILRDYKLTSDNYTEFVWGLQITDADVSDGDSFEFRVLLNGSTFTYNVTPTLTIDKTVNHTIAPNDISLPLATDSTTITQNHVIASVDTSLALTTDNTEVDGYVLLTGTYEDKATLPTTDAALSSTMTFPEKGDVLSDDNTYFDLLGSDYLIKNFLYDHDSNTDEITVTWKGKSTLAPTSSTVYLQIYNYNTTSWETLQSNSATAADTEFTLTGSKTASLSNYYTTGDKVLARVYQQVV